MGIEFFRRVGPTIDNVFIRQTHIVDCRTDPFQVVEQLMRDRPSLDDPLAERGGGNRIAGHNRSAESSADGGRTRRLGCVHNY